MDDNIKKNIEEGGINMAVMTKPLNISLRVSEENAEEFLSIKRDTASLLKKFERLKSIELKSGKSPSDPHIAFLNKKIAEFQEEMKR